MNYLSQICDNDGLRHFLDSMQTGTVLIDRDFRIVLANRQAENILGRPLPGGQELLHCFEAFKCSEEPCADCPIAGGLQGPSKPKSYSLKKPDGSPVLAKVVMTRWQEYTVLSVNDVTREVTLLKKIDLSRKEAEAKNILLDRKLQKGREELESLQTLLDNLPEAIVTVDETYAIVHRNKASREILSEEKVDRCYELLGLDLPCEDCPAEKGFGEANGVKKSHTVGTEFITEILLKAPAGEGGLLLFSDTTRQIQLIEQIREQRNTLSGLVDLSAFMQKEPEIEVVMPYFLDMFLPMIGADSAAVVVDDVRPGSIWFSLERNVGEEAMSELSRAYLSRDMQDTSSNTILEKYLPWAPATQIVLSSSQGRRVGLIALPGAYNEELSERISLFTEPLSPYIHNRLLLRQLEEKANTDPLTGLYNRGYLDMALLEEREKLEKYTIHFSLVVADVNRLKKANDVYGHEAGDALIKNVAERLKTAVRGTDIVARTGGDEFVMLLTDTVDGEAQQFIQRLKAKVFNNVVMMVGDAKDEEFPVMVSLGAAGTDLHALDDLSKKADFQMYADKEEYYKTEERYR